MSGGTHCLCGSECEVPQLQQWIRKVQAHHVYEVFSRYRSHYRKPLIFKENLTLPSATRNAHTMRQKCPPQAILAVVVQTSPPQQNESEKVTGLKNSEWKQEEAAAQDTLPFMKRGFQTDQTRLAFIFPQIVSYIWQFNFQDASCTQPQQLLKDRTRVWGISRCQMHLSRNQSSRVSSVVCAPLCRRRWGEVLVDARVRIICGYSFPYSLSQTHLCLKLSMSTFFPINCIFSSGNTGIERFCLAFVLLHPYYRSTQPFVHPPAPLFSIFSMPWQYIGAVLITLAWETLVQWVLDFSVCRCYPTFLKRIASLLCWIFFKLLEYKHKFYKICQDE